MQLTCRRQGDIGRLLAQRTEREGGYSKDKTVRDGEGHGPREGELPSARRYLLAPTLLGRAVPGLLQGRYAADGARGLPAAAAARDRDIQAYRNRRAAIGTRQDVGVGRGETSGGRQGTRGQQDRLPTRAEHYAGLRRLIGLLSALYGSAQRHMPRGQGCRQLLAERRPLRRRLRARYGSPHLLALLEQVPLRPRRVVQGGAISEARQPGHDSGSLQLRIPREPHSPL